MGPLEDIGVYVIFFSIFGIGAFICCYKVFKDEERAKRERKMHIETHQDVWEQYYTESTPVKQAFDQGGFDKELIEFIKPYQKVALEIIAEHFFPLPSHLPFKTYAEQRKRAGKIPEERDQSMRLAASNFGEYMSLKQDYFVGLDLIEEATRRVKQALTRLIENDEISGYIRPFGVGHKDYFFVPKKVAPTHSPMDASVEQNHCPKCGYKINKDWTCCPHCMALLENTLNAKIYCTNCGKKLEVDWKICPYCNLKI